MQILNKITTPLVAVVGFLSMAQGCLVMYGEYDNVFCRMNLLEMWDGPFSDGTDRRICYMEDANVRSYAPEPMEFSCGIADSQQWAARILTHGTMKHWQIQIDRAGERLQFPLESSCSYKDGVACRRYRVWVMKWC